MATRLTVGAGSESSAAFSPDGATLAFSGDYDGNTDVFTIPAVGGVPFPAMVKPVLDGLKARAFSDDGISAADQAAMDAKHVSGARRVNTWRGL